MNIHDELARGYSHAMLLSDFDITRIPRSLDALHNSISTLLSGIDPMPESDAARDELFSVSRLGEVAVLLRELRDCATIIDLSTGKEVYCHE